MDQDLDPHPLKLIKIMIIWNQGLKNTDMGLKNADLTLSSMLEKLQFFSSGSGSAFGSAKKMWIQIQIQGLKNVDLGGYRSDPATLLKDCDI